MASEPGREPNATSDADPPGRSTLRFVLNSNLGLPVDEEPWSVILPAAGIVAESTTDLEVIARALADHEADVAYIPIADFHRVVGRGDPYYQGLAIATSKITGQPTQRSLLVVRRDDPAASLADLRKAKYGYINTSCSSSYFPPAILLNKQGIPLNDFFDLTPVRPFQGQIDAVLDGTVRATMVLDDVWQSTPKNAEMTKVIGQFDDCKPPIIVVRADLDELIRRQLLDALLRWVPDCGGIYGAFKPYDYADVQSFFHELDQLPDRHKAASA